MSKRRGEGGWRGDHAVFNFVIQLHELTHSRDSGDDDGGGGGVRWPPCQHHNANERTNEWTATTKKCAIYFPKN